MPAEKPYTELTDEELLQRYRAQQDNTWLGYLLQRYTALLFGVAMKYLKNREQAEDAVQQVFLKALTHLPEELHNFKGWLYVLTRNYCLQELREKTNMVTGDALVNVAGAESSQTEMLQEEYTIGQMEEALNELPDEQKKTIELFYLKKMSYNQVMERTGYNFMQVKSYIQNGKRKLKLILLQKLKNTGGR